MHSQRGAVLIVALILLAVLTMLGIAAMSTTSLEEKMAGNTQEGTRAFQIAETGLATAILACRPYREAGCPPFTLPVHLGDSSNTKVGQAVYQGRFNGFAGIPLSDLTGIGSRTMHFDFESRGETLAGIGGASVATTLHGGAYQIAPKPH